MDISIQSNVIYAHKGSKTYKIENYHSELTKIFLDDFSKDSTCQEWIEVGFTNKEWIEFFSCYIVAKTKQMSGKLHSIIESFGGTEQEVKARKSVAFQLLDLKSF